MKSMLWLDVVTARPAIHKGGAVPNERIQTNLLIMKKRCRK